jgi:hypothetical protein
MDSPVLLSVLAAAPQPADTDRPMIAIETTAPHCRGHRNRL